MLKLYTKIDDKLAMWAVESEDPDQIPNLISDLKQQLPKGHRTAVLALIPKPEVTVTLNV
jgi:hypothetical protein